MRVGILTFHRSYNYGAVLQCFALQNILQELGAEVEVIDYVNPSEGNLRAYIPAPTSTWSLWIKTVIKNIIYTKRNKKRANAFEQFLNENLNVSVPIQKNFDWNRYHLIIVGSDQIWNHGITDGYDNVFFGNIPGYSGYKVSYAASVGTFSTNSNELQEFKRLLLSMDKISVREADSCFELERLLQEKRVTHSLDPVLTMEGGFWKQFISKKDRILKCGYILKYRVEKNDVVDRVAKCYAEQRNLKILTFELRTSHDALTCDYYESGPIEFLQLVRDAELVVTSSFHATVFSMIYEKDFIVVPHHQTGIRTIDLLKEMKLDKHLLYQDEKLVSGQELLTIDEVDGMKAIWEAKQRESIGYLKECLELC